jgi:hypothetical protein
MTIYVMIARGEIETGPGVDGDALAIGSRITYGIMPALGRPVRIHLSPPELASVLATVAARHPEAVRAAASAVAGGQLVAAEMDRVVAAISQALDVASGDGAAGAPLRKRGDPGKRSHLRARRSQISRPPAVRGRDA